MQVDLLIHSASHLLTLSGGPQRGRDLGKPGLIEEAAIDRSDHIGSLEPGKQADLLILETSNYLNLGHRFGTDLVSMVVKKGEILFGEGEEAI